MVSTEFDPKILVDSSRVPPMEYYPRGLIEVNPQQENRERNEEATEPTNTP